MKACPGGGAARGIKEVLTMLRVLPLVDQCDVRSRPQTKNHGCPDTHEARSAHSALLTF